MPIPYTPTEAPANRDSVTGPVVDGADPDNASTFNQVFQPIWNLLERVKKKAAFLDLASTFSTLQTFSAGLAGTTAALTGNATVGGTLGVTGATTVGSLASSGAVSGTTADFTGAATVGGTLGVTGDTTATNLALSGVVSLAAAAVPAATASFTNTLTRANIPKAWASITVNTGAVTLDDGFNITSVAIVGDSVVVTLAGDMANTTYVVTGSMVIGSGTTANGSVGFHSLSVGSFGFKAFSTANTVFAPASSIYTVMLTVSGRQ